MHLLSPILSTIGLLLILLWRSNKLKLLILCLKVLQTLPYPGLLAKVENNHFPRGLGDMERTESWPVKADRANIVFKQ